MPSILRALPVLLAAITAITPIASSVARAQTATPSAPSRPQATPDGNPAAWFPQDAYPPEAKAAGVEGRTAFSLDVDAKGRVTACNVTESSGSPLLDSTTCNLLIANAHFKPAKDPKGHAVAGVWTSGMRWKLTAPPPPPPAVTGDETPAPNP